MVTHVYQYIENRKVLYDRMSTDMRKLHVNENIIYTTHAICHSHKLNQEIINEMVSWGIAKPFGDTPNKWLFTQKDYERIGRASRFRKEFNINIPGAALALQLQEEIQNLRDKEF